MFLNCINVVLSILLFFISYVTYRQGWLEGRYPKDLNKSTLLVLKIEDAPKKEWLEYAQKQQKNAWEQYKFDYHFITKIDLKNIDESKFMDKKKYRYVFMVNAGEGKQTGFIEQTGLIYIYYFYDRIKDYTYHSIWDCYPTDHFSKKIVLKINSRLNKQIKKSKKWNKWSSCYFLYRIHKM